MAYRLLRREGWLVNHKRVHRLWREEGLQRPTPRNRKRARSADGSVRRNRAEHPHKVWAMDFQFDATANGRRLKFLNVIGKHSRLCLPIRVGRRYKAKDVVMVLEALTSVYPAPTYIRSDNGPEFIAHALKRWCKNSGTNTAYIEPGSSWQNGFAEAFNSRFTDEFLNTELIATVSEAQGLADRWRWEYNTLRPHSAFQGRAPLEGSTTGSCSMTTTTHSHKAWTDEGGHVTPGTEHRSWPWSAGSIHAPLWAVSRKWTWAGPGAYIAADAVLGVVVIDQLAQFTGVRAAETFFEPIQLHLLLTDCWNSSASLN